MRDSPPAPLLAARGAVTLATATQAVTKVVTPEVTVVAVTNQAGTEMTRTDV